MKTIIVALMLGQLPPAPYWRFQFQVGTDHIQAPDQWPEGVPFPSGLVAYKPAEHTQSIFTLNGRPAIDKVHRSRLLPKWHAGVPGGMEGVDGYRSDLYKLIPEGGLIWTQRMPVKNSFGFYQQEVGYTRAYPDKTLFVDVLSTKGKVFEMRAREKVAGKWQSFVVYRDRAARPVGYNGLKQSCISCHSEAGTGGYGVGLVPGGDSVLSDPFTSLER